MNWHIFHKWTKWKEIERGDIKTTYLWDDGAKVTGTAIVQQRECEECGKVQVDIATTRI